MKLHLLTKVCIASLIYIFTVSAFSQSRSEGRSIYKSPTDSLITIKKISVLPVIDNVNGIYSRPIEKQLTELIDKDHRWDLTPVNLAGPLLSPEDLSASPTKVRRFARSKTDAVIATRISKGPNGISVRMSLFLTKDGLLFSEYNKRNLPQFELNQVQDEVRKQLQEIIQKIPYQALILSRSKNRVTVNLGKRDGVTPDQILSVVQIIKMNRHPKFKFIIDTEKEILGKIRLLKVDDSLSFGKIVTEKEPGAIQKDAKISGLDFVNYGDGRSLGNGLGDDGQLMERPDALVSFGKNATAWLPKRPPTFGQVGAFIGNSLYSYNLQANVESLATSSVLNPYIALDGELWVTSTWNVHAQMKQGIVTFANPRASASPGDLSASFSYYELLFGYRFLLGPSIWGPQVEILGGYATHQLKLDASSPRGLSSTKYSGLKLGVTGSYPVDKQSLYGIGANLFFFLQPKISESVESGTGPDIGINQFGVFGYVKLGTNVKFQTQLDIELYKTNWATATFASSSSERVTSLSAGLYYLF